MDNASKLKRRLKLRIPQIRKKNLGPDARQADCVRESGISANVWSRIERGAVLPALTTVDVVADTLRCTIGDLLDPDPDDEYQLAEPEAIYRTLAGALNRADEDRHMHDVLDHLLHDTIPGGRVAILHVLRAYSLMLTVGADPHLA